MKLCAKCKRKFIPSSRHRSCGKCRYQRRLKRVCDCGRTISKDARCCKPCSSRGSKNGNWKGGRTRTAKGYVQIRVDGHPRATKSGSYVFEHIVVMERKLGRYLFDDEKVHHRNGVKSENARRNLELWIKAHPTGISVKDAITWARDVLKRYT